MAIIRFDQRRLALHGALLISSLLVSGCTEREAKVPVATSVEAATGDTPLTEQPESAVLAKPTETTARPVVTPRSERNGLAIPRINRTVYAEVVAIDQPFMVNRLGASQPGGMIFVLMEDLVQKNGGNNPTANDFRLRTEKRPRPIVLRANVGDMLEIRFHNWLVSVTNPTTTTQKLLTSAPFGQKTRYAGIEVAGLELIGTIKSDGSWVGHVTEPGGLVAPGGEPVTYKLFAKETGTFLLTSGADTTVHQLNAGLFGAVNVQPEGAEWYRSQTTHCEMQAATLEEEEVSSHEMTMVEPRKEVEKAARKRLAAGSDMASAQVDLESEQEDQAYPKGSLQERTSKTIRIAPSAEQAAVEQKVYGEGGRLYSEEHQPLINYHAVFERDDDCPGAKPNKPILSMLQVRVPEGARTATHKLDGEENYKLEIRRLDNGFISTKLRETLRELTRFGPNGIVLNRYATVARVANANRYSWVVNNPRVYRTQPEPSKVVSGRTYLLQGGSIGGVPALRVVDCQMHTVHSDLTAIITGPNAGLFPYSQNDPDFYTNPASPDRRQPYREFTVIYHQGGNIVQAFQPWSNNNLFRMINAGLDQFGINYGFAAIGPEIVANRLGVGPMGNAQQKIGTSGPGRAPEANQANDAVDLKYEEFFLSSWCVGDPAMVVDVPANAQNQMVSNPDKGSKIIGQVENNPVSFDNFGKHDQNNRPTKAFYPDDPSNVYHSYMRDHTKMRVLHAGPGPAHVHHLHAHQWLHTPNSADSTYLDSQLILPGSAYTLEITYNGSGNRNQTVGDSIFHCHFYPHFAKGMWSLWRVHDTFEEGTRLVDGVCVTKASRDQPAKVTPGVTQVLFKRGFGSNGIDGHIYKYKGTARQLVLKNQDYGNGATWEDVTGSTRRFKYRSNERIPVAPSSPLYAAADRVPNRALPDGEIASGTPTPAIVPLPTLGMAPMPAAVKVEDLAQWYGNSDGMGRRIGVVPKNWRKILAKFDANNDDDLDANERAAWDKEIQRAKNHNEENNLKYGDPGYQWEWYALYDNPGYPFFIPGVGGHRPPHPPMDMAWKEDENGQEEFWDKEKIKNDLGFTDANWRESVFAGEDVTVGGRTKRVFPQQYLDGGLPRHVVLGGDIVSQYQTRWDFTKDFVTTTDDGKHIGGLYAYQLPEEGTPVERAAMKANATRTHKSHLPKKGAPGNFILNGLPPTHGAPYADPSVTDDGNSSGIARRYQAAVIQTDVVLNKEGWHYPQQRFITLWEDVAKTVSNERPPQPFFIRTATSDATQLWHTNLVPNYYELDDFQVRTPTDVIGQHIHLVKFDVTSSDGAANGWNYEDGTFGPQEVQERIHALQNVGGLYGFDPRTGFVDKSKQKQVAVWKVADAYPARDGAGDAEHGLFGAPPPGQTWDGAMTTIQRWAIDPLLNWKGEDRTLRTVFTHDHFSPSTHQQVGLYAGVLVEPEGSHWYLPDGEPMNTRRDGGPTSWQAIIITADPEDTHREYAIEFQDMQLAYTKDSTVGPKGSNNLFRPKLTSTAMDKLESLGVKYNNATANPKAPSAFYIGQASTTEIDQVGVLISTFAGADTPTPLTGLFRSWFEQYGIFLNTEATVVVLDPKNGAPGHFGAQFLIQQPNLAATKLPINVGDYYILQATRPSNVGTPTRLSVFTPSIHEGYADPAHAVNPNWGSNRTLDAETYAGNIGTPTGAPQPKTGTQFLGDPTAFGNGAPYPSLVSTRANGTYSMNYRNEPVPLRVKSGDKKQTDLGYVYNSIDRDNEVLNSQQQSTDPLPGGSPIRPGSPYMYPPSLIPPDTAGGPQGTDPYTPLIRGYVGDDIQIRTLVGAHLQPHSFTIHGVKWEMQPSYSDSGYRNVQGMGLSEHFEMRFKMPSAARARRGTEMPNGTDYFYSASTGAVGLSNGLWGIMRSYDKLVGRAIDLNNPPEPWETDYLQPLLNNSRYRRGGNGRAELHPAPHTPINFAEQFAKADRKREFVVRARSAEIVYNDRVTDPAKNPYRGPDGIVFQVTHETQRNGQLGRVRPSAGLEPLVLRANAGEWIKVTLQNTAEPTEKPIVFPYGANVAFNELNSDPGLKRIPMKASWQMGLHPQLVEFDVGVANGINVGFNPDSTTGPMSPERNRDEITYYWYAGEFRRSHDGQVLFDEDGRVVGTPVEFGVTNLVGADLVLQTAFGLVGALVIEPEHATWETDVDPKPTRTFATVHDDDGSSFRECVLVMQNIAAGKLGPVFEPGAPVAKTVPGLHTILTPGREALPQQTGDGPQAQGRQKGFGAVNYRTESFAARGGNRGQNADKGFAEQFSNSLPAPSAENQPKPWPPAGDPKTPVFTAVAGTPTRFRVIMPATTTANSAAQPLVFRIHGHNWQYEPYVDDGKRIGDNRKSQYTGSQKVTMTQKYDIVIDSAGGPFQVHGDYLYQAFNQEQKIGIWGIFRVKPNPETRR